VKFKYKLDPTSKKDVCPQCENRRFVRMIDELGNYLSAEFGRCDRSNSCGYYKYPDQSDSDIKIDLTQRKVVKHADKVGPPSSIPERYVQQSLKGYKINSFYQFLCDTFNEQDIDSVFATYKVGTSKLWGGATVFWQISIDFEVRTGKVIKFDHVTGKRVKNPEPLTTWVHKLLPLKQFNLKQVLFGEHLLSKFPKKTVCIVESEKTAVFMAIKHPNQLWLATGGESEFKAEKLKVLRGRKVVVFPDTDFHENWSERAVVISEQLNLNLVVSSYLMNCTIAIDQKKGYDLADFKQINLDNANLIQTKNQAINSDLEQLLQQNPNLSELIRVFDLCTVTFK
jgi:hypothetical protein